MEVTDAMREYVESKVARLPRFYDGILSIDTKLDVEADQAVVEIHIKARHKHIFVARHRDEDLYACVDQCVDKITEQIRRHKDRIRGHRTAPAERLAAEGEDLSD